MKFTTILTAGILASAAAQAQEAEQPVQQPKYKKNEIGLFINPFGSNNTNGYEVPFGIQYKRWTTPNLGYRIMAGVGGYSTESSTIPELIQKDTLYYKSSGTNMSMLFVGGGLDLQRKFMGKCYLYAAVEMRGGYGKGYTHTSAVRETAMISGNERSYTYQQTAYSSTITSLFLIDATPYLGIKFAFRRLVIGTELSAVATGIMKTSYDNSPAYSNSFFDMGQLQQRFYVNFRF